MRVTRSADTWPEPREVSWRWNTNLTLIAKLAKKKFTKIHSRCFYLWDIKFNAYSIGIQRNIIESKKNISGRVGGGRSYGFCRRNVKMAFGQYTVIWIKYPDHSSNIDTDIHLINMKKAFIHIFKHIFILRIPHYTLSSVCIVAVRIPPGNYNDTILVSFLALRHTITRNIISAVCSSKHVIYGQTYRYNLRGGGRTGNAASNLQFTRHL